MLLRNDRVALCLTPALGGGVKSFRWNGREIFHTRPGDAGPLALGCFPLSPFSGRIARGRFTAEGRAITLERNHPSDPDHPHTLHGFDWLAPFETVEVKETRAVLCRQHQHGAWPWRYEAEQIYALTNDGYRHALAITNLSDRPMPAGLGLHPYFPRARARLALEIDGVWENGATLIPSRWRALVGAPDWLGRTPLDHCFTGRRGPIVIDWPSCRVTIAPDPAFTFAVVFTPPGEDYFCVEPVSHMPDAVNRRESPAATGWRWLAPGERWATTSSFEAAAKP